MKPLDINQICKRAGLTQKQLGDQLERSQASVSLWRKKGVPPELVAKVAKLTGIAPSVIRPDIFPNE